MAHHRLTDWPIASGWQILPRLRRSQPWNYHPQTASSLAALTFMVLRPNQFSAVTMGDLIATVARVGGQVFIPRLAPLVNAPEKETAAAARLMVTHGWFEQSGPRMYSLTEAAQVVVKVTQATERGDDVQ